MRVQFRVQDGADAQAKDLGTEALRPPLEGRDNALLAGVLLAR